MWQHGPHSVKRAQLRANVRQVQQRNNSLGKLTPKRRDVLQLVRDNGWREMCQFPFSERVVRDMVRLRCLRLVPGHPPRYALTSVGLQVLNEGRLPCP